MAKNFQFEPNSEEYEELSMDFQVALLEIINEALIKGGISDRQVRQEITGNTGFHVSCLLDGASGFQDDWKFDAKLCFVERNETSERARFLAGHDQISLHEYTFGLIDEVFPPDG